MSKINYLIKRGKIKYECKRAIRMIDEIIEFYKPIDGDSILDLEYREEMKSKVKKAKTCLHGIVQLNNTIITADDVDSCFCIDFDNFSGLDDLYNITFLSEVKSLKEKIKNGLKALP